MEQSNPKLIILLLLVIAGYFALQALNPHKKYSTEAFWESGTLADVDEIPAEALAPGNSNGPVLMWAATTTQDPAIIKALLNKGSAINEVDGIFKGTPLSGAASYNKNTQIIDTLMAHGADLSMRLLHDNSILQSAAMYNRNPGIIEHLIQLGADVNHRNVYGQDALDLAIDKDNEVAIEALNNSGLMQQE
jgi:ankyrin repeat protein